MSQILNSNKQSLLGFATDILLKLDIIPTILIEVNQ